MLGFSRAQEKCFLIDQQAESSNKFIDQLKDNMRFERFVKTQMDQSATPVELDKIDEGFNCIPAAAASSIAIVQRKKQKEFFENPSAKEYEQAGMKRSNEDEDEEDQDQ